MYCILVSRPSLLIARSPFVGSFVSYSFFGFRVYPFVLCIGAICSLTPLLTSDPSFYASSCTVAPTQTKQEYLYVAPFVMRCCSLCSPELFTVRCPSPLVDLRCSLTLFALFRRKGVWQRTIYSPRYCCSRVGFSLQFLVGLSSFLRFIIYLISGATVTLVP